MMTYVYFRVSDMVSILVQSIADSIYALNVVECIYSEVLFFY